MATEEDRSAAAALRLFATTRLAVNIKNEAAIARAGGIEAVVAAMGTHRSSVGVQKHGCAALGNLAAHYEDNRAAIARAGGIVAVVAAMWTHRSSVGVQDQGCWALVNLAFENEENQTAIARAGGIEAV
ncbi:armadillo-type protein, partial [Baffinella frigidus]